MSPQTVRLLTALDNTMLVKRFSSPFANVGANATIAIPEIPVSQLMFIAHRICYQAVASKGSLNAWGNKFVLVPSG